MKLQLVLGLLTTVASGAAAQNRPQFPELKLTEVGTLACVVALDVDADGHLDVAALRTSAPTGVLVAHGDGAGRLGVASVQPAHNLPGDLEFADLDGDGLPDALVVNVNSDDVSVLLNGGGTLLPAVHFATDEWPEDSDVGDLDGDGVLDVAAACRASNTLVVLRGDGAGGLLPPEPHPGLGRPEHVALADFDEDGDLDAVVGDTFDYHLAMFIGDGAGGFLPVADLGPTPLPGWMEVADLNEDGHADVAVVGIGSPGVQILLGDGHGDLEPHGGTYTPGQNVGARAELADIDADGHLDLLVGRESPAEIAVYRGHGTGTFALSHVDRATNAEWLDTGDFDEDGRLDVVGAGDGQAALSLISADVAGRLKLPVPAPLPAQSGPLGHAVTADVDADDLPDLLVTTNAAPKGLLLYRGLGDGSWSTTQVWSDPDSAAEVAALAAGDMNVDGNIDVVVTSAVTGRVRVLLGNGQGAFAQHDLEATGTAPVAASIGSLNGDGLPDVAVALQNQGAVHLFFGEGGGRIGPASPLALPGQGVDVVVTDVTGDAVPDVLGATFSRVVLWTGHGTGSFTGPQTWALGGQIRSVTALDLQPDGVPDVVAGLGAFADDGQVALLVGNGNGGLFAPALVDAGDAARDVIGFDANGDGLMDIAIAEPTRSSVSLLEQDGRGGLLPRRAFGAQEATEIMAADANGDGAADLLFAGSRGVGALLNGDGPLDTLGAGLAGGAGVPALAALSDFTPGAPLSLRLQQAAPLAPATLVAGLSLAAAPFKGGVLVPDVDALVALATDSDGAVTIDTAWPVGLPSGLQVWLQSWIPDSGASQGLAASRGLQVTTP